MTDRDIEIRLKKAVDECTPDVLDRVLQECDNYSDKLIPFSRNKKYYKRLSVIAACILLVFSLFAYRTYGAHHVASIVFIEVNPSIELRINKDETVLKAEALNSDGQDVLGNMKLEGTDIHTATNAILGSLLKHGYIDELANSILLSVEDKDSIRGEALQKILSEEINAILNSASVNAAILSQYVEKHSVDTSSEKFDISHGKAALIESILDVNSRYSFDELSQLSVNELNLILSNSKNHVEDVDATGTASDNAYIGSEMANSIAFEHAGIPENSVYKLEVEMDYEYHTMVYDVEFVSGDIEYEYYINAETGEVIEVETEAAE